MTKGKIGLKIGLFSILALLFTSLGCSDSGENPDFSFPSELTDIAGQQFDPQSLEGKPIVINFFASWCDPCKREMSEIERINSRSYKPELASQYLDDLNVTFVGINSGETDINRAKDLIDQTGASYIILYGDDGTLLQNVGAVGLPFTIFISSEGKIVGTHLTAMSSDDVYTQLNKYFKP